MRINRLVFGSLMVAGALFSQNFSPEDVADEPGRPVTRISVLSGDASVRRSDSGEWVAAALNAPLLGGDSVTVASGGAMELQFDRANFARVAGDTELRLSEVENGRQQVQLGRGLVTWRVLRESSAQTEISTPVAAVRPEVNSAVRVEVAADGSTRVTVRHGSAEVYSQRGTEQLREGNALFVRGDSDVQAMNAAGRDQWDTWNDERDAYLQRAQSPRYVSQDIYGAEDLDSYGRWDYDATYGNVWMPTVAASWAPYQDGQWSYEPYYGWTWVDRSPWGWAPFHYGSWYRRANYGWAWYPGQRYDRVWWRPALVGFVGFGGGSGFGFGFGNVGWVPLAPYERYYPWYGRGWSGGRTVVVNNFNFGGRNNNINGAYRNARYGGVTAVSASDFQRGNFRNRVPVTPGHLSEGGLARSQMAVSSGTQFARFSDRAASNNVRSENVSRQFYSRTNASAGGQAPQQSRGFAQGGQTAEGQRMVTNPGWRQSGRQDAVQRGRQFGVPQSDPNARQAGGRDASARVVPQAQQQQQQQQTRGFYSGPARQVQVAPQIVHERDAAASPNVERRGGNFGSPSGFRGDWGGSRQQEAQPRVQQQSQPQVQRQAAPSFRGGGGGEARMAPRAEAPQQRSNSGDRGNARAGGEMGARGRR